MACCQLFQELGSAWLFATLLDTTKRKIGVVFEVAVILGLRLFDADQAALTGHLRHAEEKLALLPKSVRKTTRAVDDEF